MLKADRGCDVGSLTKAECRSACEEGQAAGEGSEEHALAASLLVQCMSAAFSANYRVPARRGRRPERAARSVLLPQPFRV
jgi:hypothetical protein